MKNVSFYVDGMLRCPNCGGEAWISEVYFNDGDIWYRPECSHCNVGWKENYPTVEEAVSAWNKHRLMKEKYDAGFKRNPFRSAEADAYVTAVNILAVEYLVKTNNPEEYSRRINQIYKLTDDDLSVLWCHLSLNMHTSTLGAMITQGDYECQLENLFDFLDRPEER